MIICSNCINYNTEVRRNNEPIILFFYCLPLSTLLHYIYRNISKHMFRYASENEKFMFYDRAMNCTFLAAN